MRCYFMRNGHITVAAVELLDAVSDEEAIEKAKSLFAERRYQFEGFEVWDGARKVVAHSPSRADDGPYVDG